jgi:hypothetical protein
MPTAPANPEAPPPSPDLNVLLARPLDQRVREYKYRFAQSAVFGLPVLGLQCFGRSLGGSEADTWVALFQALLAGWVVYVGAAGMLFEGLLLLRRTVTFDLLIAALVVLLYLASLPSVVHALVRGSLWYPTMFHLCILLLLVWTAIRWRQLHSALGSGQR